MVIEEDIKSRTTLKIPTIDYFRRTPFRAYQISYQKRFIEIGVNHCILKGFIVFSETRRSILGFICPLK